ncbi:hypothetical protein BBP40_009161 [Aspergillus hancockii]|nr:hypothetical protein BBP40_009161 [Aspergillus hancockii]
MADQSPSKLWNHDPASKLSGRFEQDLAGKTALVTLLSLHHSSSKTFKAMHECLSLTCNRGATRGIGRATAFHLAKRGASILGTCSSETSMHNIESLSSEVTEYYRGTGCDAPKIVGIAANVLSLNTPGIIAEAVKKHFDSKVHILVNNAAYDELREMGKLDDEYVRKVLVGNTHTLVMLVEALYTRGMIQPDSRIINMSSESGRKIPFPAMYLVGATKATMEALTRSWAGILGKDPKTLGTTVNALAIGATATDALLREAPPELQKKGSDAIRAGSILGGEMGLPEDIANVAGLLASERARWITGSVLNVDGYDNGGQAVILYYMLAILTKALRVGETQERKREILQTLMLVMVKAYDGSKGHVGETSSTLVRDMSAFKDIARSKLFVEDANRPLEYPL